MHSLQIQLYATLGILKKKKKNEGGKKVMWAESVGEWKWKGEKRKKGFEKDVDKRGESWERVEKMEDES